VPIPPPTPTPTPAERFADILWYLAQAVVTRSAFGLSQPLINLIITRIRDAKQAFARLAARIDAGTYAPRRRSATPPRPPAVQKPRQPPNPLARKFGWLLPLVPAAVVFRGQLETLLRDPGMAELLAVAPVSLRRPIRSLCWMLRVDPPDILALPKKSRPPREKKPRAKRETLPPYYPPTPPNMPSWWADPPRLTRWPKGISSPRRRPPKTA